MKFIPANLRDRLLPITLAQLIGLVCGVLGVKISTHLVSPADYGAYGVFLTFVPLGMWVVHAGLVKYISRHWLGSTTRGALLRSVLRAYFAKLPWLLLATALAAIAMASGRWWQVWLPLSVAASLLSIALLAQTALQAERAHWGDLAVSTSASLTRTFLPPLFYAFGSSTMLALETGFCLHAFVYAAPVLYLLLKYKSAAAPASPIEPVYEGNLFVVLSLAGWTMTGVNRWIVAGFFGADQAGFFTLATNISLIVTSMLGTVFMQYFQPVFFSANSNTPSARNELASRVDRVAAAYCGLSLSGIMALRLIAPYLIGTLINEKYRAALPLIVATGCFSAAMTTTQFFHVMLLAGKREKACGPHDIATAVLFSVGGVVAATLGEHTLQGWLMATPVIPWILSRPIARHYFFKPAAADGHAPAP